MSQPREASSPAADTDAAAELARLRQENARLKLEKEILKNRPRAWSRPFGAETRSA